ncbi:MAG TPA: hypothetical protein VGR80_09095 [Steroidobacteraceae bacterium]|nr:hypothetical protein [Steroidobacteraceae bacterium]
MRAPSPRRPWCAAACCAALALAACRQSAPPEAAAPAADQERSVPQPPGLTLEPAEVAKAGIVTVPAAPAMHAPESGGYALVVPREAIAQAVAELTSAAAVERASRAALARGRGLAGTPGAVPVEAQEAAERQAAVDHAALVLAEQRLSAAYGSEAPWKGNYASPLLSGLAAGARKLARVTFPLGALGAATPAKLRFMHLGAAPGRGSFESVSVWAAPADSSIPGRSFFALLKAGDASEGERLLARAPTGAPEAGVLVPYAAAVISGGRYWCYVEVKPGAFVRTGIDVDLPTEAGYFVRTGVAPGAQIVTRSAAELLARELNPSPAAD